MAERGRPVFASDRGRLCPDCGQALAACSCGQARPATGGKAAAPAKAITAKLRLETHGRGGKAVTVIDGLPDSAEFLATLAAELKRALATGGTVRPGGIELAGDRRERLRALLAARGMRVKG